MRRTYGEPPDTSLFRDLLVIHELGHLYHAQAGFWFPERWLAELFANLALEAWVNEQQPQLGTLLRVFPRCFRDIDTSGFPTVAIDDMEQALLGPQGPIVYAWYQTVLEDACTDIWAEAGPGVLRDLHQRFRDGRSRANLRAALADIRPVFISLIDNWPRWPDRTIAVDRPDEAAGSPA